jgi:hypothetical protein
MFDWLETEVVFFGSVVEAAFYAITKIKTVCILSLCPVSSESKNKSIITSDQYLLLPIPGVRRQLILHLIEAPHLQLMPGN